MFNEAIFMELLDVRREYGALIDRRIRWLAKGEVSEDKNSKFVMEENMLDRTGQDLRKRLGIKVIGEAMLCRECRELFPYNYVRDRNNMDFKGCMDHEGAVAHEIRRGEV